MTFDLLSAKVHLTCPYSVEQLCQLDQLVQIFIETGLCRFKISCSPVW